MFKTHIILVDDDQEYLDQLNRAFAMAGLSCLPIVFDRNNPDNVSGIDHIAFDTSHARIIALDINLRESPDTKNAKALYPTIEAVLKKLKPSGPYYLIFWSKYKDLPREIIELLTTRSKDEVVAPLGWGFLDKLDFQASDPPDELRKKLLELVNQVCIFRLLLGWENRTSFAASYTLSELYKIAATSHDNGWNIQGTNEKLITLLTHVAHESVGHKNAKNTANHAVEAGLLPILEDRLLGMTSEGEVGTLNDEWAGCLKKLGSGKDLEALTEEDIANLNTFYNLEEVPSTYSKIKRGVFVRLKEPSCKPMISARFFSRIFGKGNSYNNLITEEFLFNTEARDKKFRDEARKNLILGWLEIGATCDHDQQKNRLHRFLLSALVPLEYSEMTCKKRESGMSLTAHEGIYRSPVLQYQGKQYIMLISFRYTTGLHKDSCILDEPLFRLKEQIINAVAFAWSKHSIRPGITSFR